MLPTLSFISILLLELDKVIFCAFSIAVWGRSKTTVQNQ